MEENLKELANVPDSKSNDDDDLDSFFAKKDKGKKNKKKKKFITTESLAKKIERANLGEEEEVKKKEKESAKSADSNKGVNNNDHEEWHEFEDESQRDYSDLKIQNFQIREEHNEEVIEPQYNEEGELIPPKEEGPWKSIAKDQSSSSPSESMTVHKVEKASEPTPVTKSVYRPPHARLSTTNASPSSRIIQGRRRRQQEAPVINSEIDFPSLSSAVRDTEQHTGFETVKAGAKSISRNQQQIQQQQQQAPSLKLGNQFQALGD